MTTLVLNQRQTEADVDCIFTDRWSPRAFSSEPITDAQLETLFEAARWAPSSYNEQPWRFVVARTPGARQQVLSTLVEQNQVWACHAPILMYVLVRQHFEETGRPNRQAPFDCGAAWMSMALQARRLGLYTHGMAGFSAQRAHRLLGTSPEEYDIIAVIAVGHRGDASTLPEELQELEHPNNRKTLAEVYEELL